MHKKTSLPPFDLKVGNDTKKKTTSPKKNTTIFYLKCFFFCFIEKCGFEGEGGG